MEEPMSWARLDADTGAYISSREERERILRENQTTLGKIAYYMQNKTLVRFRLKDRPEYFYEGQFIQVEDYICSTGKYKLLSYDEWIKNIEILETEEDSRTEEKKKKGMIFPPSYTISHYNGPEHFVVKLTNGDNAIFHIDDISHSSLHPASYNPIQYFERGYISEEKRRLVKERCNNLCELKLIGCTGKFEEVDHWIPSSRSGTEDISNLRGACSHCNKKKSDRLWEEIPAEEKL
jgi:hypothetical protein